MTLVELLLAMTIMTMLAASLAALSSAVRQGADYNDARGAAAQHGRVALQRIGRLIAEAKAAENYPGMVVVTQTVGSARFSDTLVIWHPAGTPANADGPPLASELSIICPDPSAPHRLLEISMPGNSMPVEMNDGLNTATGRALIDGFKRSAASNRLVLTDKLRVASPSSGTSYPGDFRGCVCFERHLHPTTAEISQFRAGTLAWDSIAWPQNLHSATTGLRHVALSIELQLRSDSSSLSAPAASAEFEPLLGSASLEYVIKQ